MTTLQVILIMVIAVLIGTLWAAYDIYKERNKPIPKPPPFSSQVNHEIMQELSAELRRRVHMEHEQGYILNKSVLHYCDDLDNCLRIQLARIKKEGPDTYKKQGKK